jgi:hypothetical protein
LTFLPRRDAQPLFMTNNEENVSVGNNITSLYIYVCLSSWFPCAAFANASFARLQAFSHVRQSVFFKMS